MQLRVIDWLKDPEWTLQLLQKSPLKMVRSPIRSVPKGVLSRGEDDTQQVSHGLDV